MIPDTFFLEYAEYVAVCPTHVDLERQQAGLQDALEKTSH